METPRHFYRICYSIRVILCIIIIIHYNSVEIVIFYSYRHAIKLYISVHCKQRSMPSNPEQVMAPVSLVNNSYFHSRYLSQPNCWHKTCRFVTCSLINAHKRIIGRPLTFLIASIYLFYYKSMDRMR